jgi:hypothetical protein
MRTITAHAVNGANEAITIEVMDEPGAGGANHIYRVVCPTVAPELERKFSLPLPSAIIKFQNGPIGEVGVNGLTHEVLLAIVADRLRSFQAGPFACLENAEALKAVVHALDTLKRRTAARMARGIEGKSIA